MAENLKFVFSADLSDFQNKLKSVESQLKGFGDKMKDIGGSLSTYLSLPLAAMGGAALKAFGDIQALKSGLQAVTGSAAEANTQFTRLKDLAKLPGLGLKEVTKGSINLQVIGFTAEKAEKSIRAFGNAVATVGGGKDQFERATYGLAQLANTDFPLGEDLNIIKDAIPQVTPLLKEAFGSARSDELKELGITSAQVVDTIVNGLSKLPPVTGGVNNAFENLKDGVFQNLAEIGEIINNTVDISAFTDKIVAGITALTDRFKNLSPETQKVVLAIAGLAIVIPPLMVAIGVFTSTVLPALLAGFGAMAGGFGLAVVAIGAGIALIIQNWDSISAYFTSGDGSKFWEAVKGYATDLWDSLVSIFNSIKDFVTGIWQTIGVDVINFVSASFGQVLDIIKLILGNISGFFKVFASVIKGDWKGAWEGVKGIFVNVWNGITSILKNFLSQIASGLAMFFKLIGAEGIGNSLSSLPATFDKIFGYIQIPIDKATEAVKDFKKEVAGVTATVKATPTPTTTTPAKTVKDVKTDQKRDVKGVKEDVLLDTFDNYNTKVDKVQMPDVKPVLAFTGVMSEAQIAIAETMQKMNESIGSALTSGISSLASGFAEMVGQMASGNMGMKDVVSGLIGIMADMAVQIGKIAIATGVAMLGIKSAFSNPLTAIAAGVALVALGGFVKGSIAKVMGGGSSGGGGGQQNKPRMFANGGIVSSPTYAMFGEYPSAGRGNPEVVAPLNKLKSYISDNGGMSGDVAFRIQGDALVGVLNNYDKKQFRTQ